MLVRAFLGRGVLFGVGGQRGERRGGRRARHGHDRVRARARRALRAPRDAADARRGQLTIGTIIKISQIFGGLVLGCIKTKFCKKICVRKHFSSSTRFASFCTAAISNFSQKIGLKNCEFRKISENFRKFWQIFNFNLQKIKILLNFQFWSIFTKVADFLNRFLAKILRLQRCRSMQILSNLVELEKCCQTHILKLFSWKSSFWYSRERARQKFAKVCQKKRNLEKLCAARRSALCAQCSSRRAVDPFALRLTHKWIMNTK